MAGVFGAIVAGIWIYAVDVFQEVSPPLNTFGITLPAGTISGFFSCFFVYLLYFKLIDPEDPQAGFFRPVFGGLAGVLSGVMTGIAYLLSYTEIPHVWQEFISCGLVGAFMGGLTGIVAGFIFGPIFGKLNKNRS